MTQTPTCSQCALDIMITFLLCHSSILIFALLHSKFNGKKVFEKSDGYNFSSLKSDDSACELLNGPLQGLALTFVEMPTRD